MHDVAMLEEQGERQQHPLTTRQTGLKAQRPKHVSRKTSRKIQVAIELIIYMDTTTTWIKSVKSAIRMMI